MSNDYLRLFADTCLSSFIDFNSSSKTGEVVWEVKINEDKEPAFDAKVILAADNFLVVYSSKQIAVFSSQGKKLWVEEYIAGSPVSIYANNIYFRSPKTEEDRLSAIHLGGTAVEAEMILLDTFESAQPVYIEPMTDGLIAACAYATGSEEGPPETVFYKKQYDTRDYLWVSSFFGYSNSLPLHIKTVNRFVIFGGTKVMVFNSAPKDVEEEVANFSLPLDMLLTASADQNGILYLLGTSGRRIVIVALTLDGRELWRYEKIPYGGDRSNLQPPMVGIDGLIHVAVGTTMTTIKAGKLVRTFRTDSGPIGYVTALADGAVLISSNRTLYQIDSNGKRVFKAELTVPIVAPAVLTETGNVCVITSNTIVCLN
ncbi:MAG: hypothetical protein DRH90_21570 [Deltaproteobacteria bacterium]|nr:MAG: hypothetical protein DRH90_21570 [Deltaproteobacteria bacterium]